MNNGDKLNNPAGRLHTILDHALNTNGGTIRSVYAKVLEIDPSNLGEILRMLGILSNQAAEIQVLLGTLENPMYSEQYAQCLAGIKRCFEVESVAVPWDAFKNQHVRREYLMALSFCSIPLGERCGEKTIAPDVMATWLDKITKLHDEVKNSNLDASLKGLILNSLERIRAGIRDYRVRGIRAIREAIIDMVESVPSDMNARIRVEAHRERNDARGSPPIVTEWVAIAADIAQIVLFGMAISPLFTSVLLPLLPGR
jgi:hypothetical protein